MKPYRFEVYMLVKDRKRLARLIEIQEVSKREVARAAGWRSHSYLLRLLSGERNTLEGRDCPGWGVAGVGGAGDRW